MIKKLVAKWRIGIRSPRREVCPIYMVHKGEVIGVEYMWSQDMVGEEIRVTSPEGDEVFQPLPTLSLGGDTADHMDITFLPEGHPGLYELPHWDIHIYFISQEEKAAIMPEG